jgi:Prolipoprotein diacylglyceryltransferase
MSFHGGFLGCVAAVMLFCRATALPILSLGDITTGVGPIGCSWGGSPTSSTASCGAGRRIPACPGPWCSPMAGRCRGIPSQLYEAGLEGILLFTVLAVMIRMGALKRPGLILGSFIAIYAIARIIGEFFREPDPQLGFLWGGLTMGMLLSVPMIIAGAILIVMAWRKAPEHLQKSI